PASERMKSSSGALPHVKPARSCEPSRGSTRQSSMMLPVSREGAAQRFVGRRRVLQQFGEGQRVALAERLARLLVEAHLVLRDDLRLADAYLRIADLLDQDGAIRER